MSGNEIEQTEGYAAALSVPDQPDEVSIHATQQIATELLALRALLVPLQIQEITATVVDLVDDRTVTEHTGTPGEVAALLNGDSITRVHRHDAAQWIGALTTAGFTTPSVDTDFAGSYTAFTAAGVRYCLAEDISGDTKALVLTRDYRQTYNPDRETPEQRAQLYIYAASIRLAVQEVAKILAQ